VFKRLVRGNREGNWTYLYRRAWHLSATVRDCGTGRRKKKATILDFWASQKDGQKKPVALKVPRKTPSLGLFGTSTKRQEVGDD